MFLLALSVGSLGTPAGAQGDATEAVTAAPLPDIVQKFLDAYNAHDAAAILELYAEDATFDDVAMGAHAQGLTELTPMIQAKMTLAADSDYHMDIVNSWVEGGHGAMEWVVTGTDTGIFKTGKTFTLRGATLFDTEGTTFSRAADYYDVAGMMMQLGVLPAPQ